MKDSSYSTGCIMVLNYKVSVLQANVQSEANSCGQSKTQQWGIVQGQIYIKYKSLRSPTVIECGMLFMKITILGCRHSGPIEKNPSVTLI
jgi:hypothetical protein